MKYKVFGDLKGTEVLCVSAQETQHWGCGLTRSPASQKTEQGVLYEKKTHTQKKKKQVEAAWLHLKEKLSDHGRWTVI